MVVTIVLTWEGCFDFFMFHSRLCLFHQAVLLRAFPNQFSGEVISILFLPPWQTPVSSCGFPPLQFELMMI